MPTTNTEIVTTRLFHSPRVMLFEAFARPEQLALWWGPMGFTNTFHEFDFRVGGMWRFVMHGPDGTDYANESVFEEIIPLERIVFRHLQPMHVFVMAMDFVDMNGNTQLTWRMQFESAEECERVRSFAEPANEQNFDRLHKFLTC